MLSNTSVTTPDLRSLEAEIVRLRKLLIHDDLTGCLNRAAWEERAYAQCALVERGRCEKFAILYIDLDKFKNINDIYGHAEGDRVLALMGRLLRENVSRSDFVGRRGGDEFIVLLNRTDAVGAVEAAGRILSALNAAGISASIGVCGIISNDLDRTIAYADAAMYCVKKVGGNGVYNAII